jgi:predicted glutamine amidotransferase
MTVELGARGACNYLLSNGDCLFAHCSNQLSYIIRQAPFSVAHLRDQDLSIDFSAVTTPDDRVAVIATVPLTDNERWITMPNGSLWLFEEGAAVRHQLTVAGPVKVPS